MNQDFSKILKSLAPGYLIKRRDELAVLETAIAESDFEKLKILGHQMKGHGPSYGFPRIGEIGIQIELGAQRQNLEELRVAARNMREFLNNPQSAD